MDESKSSREGTFCTKNLPGLGLDIPKSVQIFPPIDNAADVEVIIDICSEERAQKHRKSNDGGSEGEKYDFLPSLIHQIIRFVEDA